MAEVNDREPRQARSLWDRFTRPPFRLVFNGWWCLFLFFLGPALYAAGRAVAWAGRGVEMLVQFPIIFVWWRILLGFSHTRDFRDR